MRGRDLPRIALTAYIMGLFGYIVVVRYSASIEQTVLSISMLAVGYWLGSSKGSSVKTDLLATDQQDGENR